MLDHDIAQDALEDEAIRRLLTITGVNLAVAAGLMAAIGIVARFSSPQKLVSYFGLNPRVRRSGLGAAHHGRISQAGRSHARAMLVEAAWAAAKAPGPLCAFSIRVRARHGHQIAATPIGGCDDCEETTLGSSGTEEVVVTRTAAGCDPRGFARILGGDRCGPFERGRGGGSGCIEASGIKVVPEVWRHATHSSFGFGGAAVWTLPVFQGPGGDRAASCPRPRRVSHRQDSEPRFVDDFA